MIRKLFKDERFWIVAAALAVRSAYVLFLAPATLAVDSGDWISLANSILHGTAYASTYRGPLYPVFLAGIFGVFGQSILAVRLAQAFLGALTCLLVYAVAKKVFGRKTGIAAGAITVFYPYLIYQTGDILSESLFTFLVALSVYCILEIHERPSLDAVMAGGIASGLTLLCKGTFLLFLAPAALWLLVAAQHELRKRLVAVSLLTLCTVVTIAPWVARNCRHYGTFVLFGLSGQSLWLANNPEAIRIESLPDINAESLDNSFAWYDGATYSRILALPPLAADAAFKAEARTFIRENPGMFLTLAGRRLVHFWRLYPVVASARNKIAALLTSGIVLPLGWIGIALAAGRHWRRAGYLIGILGAFTFAHTVFLATIRYRIPVEPYIIIFAAYTIVTLFERTGIIHDA